MMGSDDQSDERVKQLDHIHIAVVLVVIGRQLTDINSSN